jgi:hypothetical protein
MKGVAVMDFKEGDLVLTVTRDPHPEYDNRAAMVMSVNPIAGYPGYELVILDTGKVICLDEEEVIALRGPRLKMVKENLK